MRNRPISKAEMREREKHARRWLQFRKNFLFTQVKLAEELGVGRRTVQLIEHARVTPTLTTQRTFRDFARKCVREDGQAA